nr:hypothetical protein [Bacteroides acidifaciens]
MDYKDYSEYNEVDTVNGDDITLQVVEMSDGDKYVGVMNGNEGESEVNRMDFFMLTSDQARAFADKLRRYADKIDGVKLP